jgi:hypothetical protein
MPETARIPLHRRQGFAAGFVLSCLACAAAATLASRLGRTGGGSPGSDGLVAISAPAHFEIEADGYRFEYHAVTGTERLFRVRSPVREDLSEDEPDVAGRLREALRIRLGVEDLELLRVPHRETIESLRRLGYL